MQFEFATTSRIIFGPGKLAEIGPIAAEMGKNACVVTGSNLERARLLLNYLTENGLTYTLFSVSEEPTISRVQAGVEQLKASNFDLVIGIGGGSAIDAGKAMAALATNPGDPLVYLEVIGQGKPLTHPPLPYIAIPTTAGTGAEVTRNAVLASPEHRVKVSLRHPLMLPDVALVDSTLTCAMPPHITASTGMDAITQLLEPFVSQLANPLTDSLCREGLHRAARSLQTAYESGDDASAREDMALASLFGGLALANAKLGAVHGFAGVLGGMYKAPHGAVCAALLPATMTINISAMQARSPENSALQRYREVAQIFAGNPEAGITDGISWVQSLSASLDIPPLGDYGIQPQDFPAIIEKSARSSSMKGNPVQLTYEELAAILEQSI